VAPRRAPREAMMTVPRENCVTIATPLGPTRGHGTVIEL
jgi:hypothetical protein